MTKEHNIPTEGWREITWDDVPPTPDHPDRGRPTAEFRAEIEVEMLELFESGVLNSERQRITMLRNRKWKDGGRRGQPNSSPGAKFQNEHAFILNYLVQGTVLEIVSKQRRDSHGHHGSTTYRIVPESLAFWRSLTASQLTLRRGGNSEGGGAG